ncbi:hypothetical protein OH460_07740 [Vibrio sp. Makdt]|uniref:hypothetical protein n=1 Tax=Vibrio sp. Makdt TaxID=2998828 RepID=UPI0022CD2768|nr:hypothetical protein [Vibrio sp. Makdt]MDA0152188.1 hypothetical protein [Vibrio sp. Makdt]
MAKPKFSVGQRAFVSSLNPNHSIYKKQCFLGSVVTIINVREQKNGFRYFIQLATDKRYTMFILEKYLEQLTNQVLSPRDKANLRVNHASEVLQFDKDRLSIPSEKELLWDAYLTLDHGDHDERLAMLSKLENYFDKVGKPPTKS